MNHVGRIDPQAALSKDVVSLLGHDANNRTLEAVIAEANGLPLDESAYSPFYPKVRAYLQASSRKYVAVDDIWVQKVFEKLYQVTGELSPK